MKEVLRNAITEAFHEAGLAMRAHDFQAAYR